MRPPRPSTNAPLGPASPLKIARPYWRTVRRKPAVPLRRPSSVPRSAWVRVRVGVRARVRVRVRVRVFGLTVGLGIA